MTKLFESGSTEDNPIDQKVNELKTKFTREDGSVDVDALLSKAAHADIHIPKLERKLDEQTQDLIAAKTMEDIVKQIEASNQERPTNQNQPGEQRTPSEQPQTLTRDEVLQILRQEKQQATAEQNLYQVRGELEKAWGSNAQTYWNDAVKASGMTEAELMAIGAKSPQALIKLVGAVPSRKEEIVDTAPPRNRMGGQHVTTSAPKKNWAYYKKMRKEDPQRYYSPSNFIEMENAAHSNPDFNKE